MSCATFSSCSTIPPAPRSRWRAPGSSPASPRGLHAVEGTAERYVILRGEGLVEVGGISRAVARGDRVLIPPGVPQRITNTGERDLEFFCICTPRFLPSAYRDLEV